MPQSPLDPHVATPQELQRRIAADRRGAPYLVYRDGLDRQVVVELAGERIAIGRRATCAVSLPWDSEVSRVHAEIEQVGDDWVLSDDGLSRNGTFVNGERITARRRLRDGDVIVIGETAIVFATGDAPSSQSTATALRPGLGDRLTPAQRRVLVALCRPFRDQAYAAPATNRQIAAELVVSVDTVKGTLRTLFDLFGVDDLPQNQKRASLALAALRAGIVNRRDL
jgi:pSer/pThr/pTyr-binding forkhead associated (FHA) protein